jgi:hypothetical protein
MWKEKKKMRCCELPALYSLVLDYLFVTIHHLLLTEFFSIDFCLFFCRLKINHDSHEFIPEFGTVENSNEL